MKHLSLSLIFLVFGFLQTAEATNFKCTAYCGQPSKEVISTTEKERCRGEIWSKSCGGVEITRPNYSSLQRYNILSKMINEDSVEAAYASFERTCWDRMASYGSGNGFIFRRFDQEKNAVLPDVDDVLKSCVEVN